LPANDLTGTGNGSHEGFMFPKMNGYSVGKKPRQSKTLRSQRFAELGMLLQRIWLVGIEGQMAADISLLLSHRGIVAEQVAEQDLTFSPNPKPTAIVLSVIDSGMRALNTLVWAQRSSPPIPVLVLVGSAQCEVAATALKLGAVDAVTMPVDSADLLPVLELLQQKDEECPNSPSKPGYPKRTTLDTAALVSLNSKMLKIWNVARIVARTDLPVLILGESGVGKEVLARFIHKNSRRTDKPLIKVNCAALPHDLLESELFGYERGAFTGAVGDKPGIFELADTGSIILDEIGEIPPSLQAKLLHVLEDGEFSRLGGRRRLKVDARVLALTNRKLHEAIPRGEFRDDLYFRLSVVKIDIPPLRERKEDILPLASYFLNRHRDALASPIEELTPELIDVFMEYHWPGNVRELENTIRRYLILPDDLELTAAASSVALSPDPPKRAIAAPAASQSKVVRFPGPNDTVSLKDVSSSVADCAEREMVMHVLEQTNWNRSHAARRLCISYRALLNKLKKWKVNGRQAVS
jgi:two-component system response regulator AtoC